MKLKKNVFHFLAATFILSWITWGICIILDKNITALIILGACWPSIIAIAFTFLTETKEERKEFWNRLLSFKRMGLVLTLTCIFIYFFYFAVNTAIYKLFVNDAHSLEALITNVTNIPRLIGLIVILFIIGPLGEEIGWRGYVIDLLVKRFGTIGGNIILGLIWGIWHLPLFFVKGTVQHELGLFTFSGLIFMINCISMCFIYYWFYIKTNRSIMSAILIHFSHNFFLTIGFGIGAFIPFGYCVIDFVLALLLATVLLVFMINKSP